MYRNNKQEIIVNSLNIEFELLNRKNTHSNLFYNTSKQS